MRYFYYVTGPDRVGSPTALLENVEFEIVDEGNCSLTLRYLSTNHCSALRYFCGNLTASLIRVIVVDSRQKVHSYFL